MPSARVIGSRPPPAQSCRARRPQTVAARQWRHAQHHCFLLPFGCSQQPASASVGVPPLAGTTRLSLGVGLQRGHASRAAPLARAARYSVSARLASPLYPVRGVVGQSVANAEYRDCQAPGVLFSAAGGRRVMSARARYGHPLRFYIRPHFVKRPPVASLKLRLVPAAATRPTGSQNRPYAKWPKLGRLFCVSAWHCPGATRSVLFSGLRPVTRCQPRPPSRPPPWGSQQPGTCAALARRATRRQSR